MVLKQLTAIGLLIIMFYSQAGYYFTYLYAQLQVKREMKARILNSLPDESFEAIILTGNEQNIQWEEEDREFSFKGQLYDVVRKKTVNGNVVLLCINDKKEENLVRQLSNTVKSGNQNNNGKNTKATFLKLTCDLAIIDFSAYDLFSVPGKQSFTSYAVTLPVRITSITLPPPKA